MLWFTVQQRNDVERLDPHSGMIILKKVPLDHALPYGIAVNSKGVPFFCEFGTSKLPSINPETMEITVRNMVATPDGKLYLACSGVNKVAIAEMRH